MSITERLEAATVKAEDASTKMHQVVHGDVNTDVSTETGSVPSLKKWYREIAYMQAEKKAMAAPLTAGVNTVPMASFAGDAVDPAKFTEFSMMVMRAGVLADVEWQYLPETDAIRIVGAVAGDVPIAVQRAIGGGDISLAPVSVDGVAKQLQEWLAELSVSVEDLPDATLPLSGNELVELGQGGEGRQISVADLLSSSQSRGVYTVLGAGLGVDGTAAMQQAIDAWDADPDLTIRIVGKVELMSPVIIPNKETLNPERRLTITGGSIAKKNAGFMFTRPSNQSIPVEGGGTLQLQTGHVTFDGVRFLGPRTTAGTYILDGDNVIRAKFMNCYGDGIQIVYAAGYLQSIYVDTASVFRKWSGWLFDCGHLFDIKWYGTAEAGQHFMRTRDTTADPAANSLTVRGCIEGLSGKVFEIGPCFGTVIDGNYGEANAGGDFDFSIGTGFHKGLTLIGNGFQPSTAQLADPNYYPVKLGKGAANSIVLIGNSSTGNLFDVAGGNQAAIVDMGNWCGAGKKKFSPTSPRKFSFDATQFIATLLPGYGVNLDSYDSALGFENTRATVNGESRTTQITYGTVNPQTTPSAYTQTAWVVGSLVLQKAPTIANRQYGTGVVHPALILGWVCMTSGAPGTWQEISILLPY